MIIKKGIDNIALMAKMRFCTPGHKGKLDTCDITEIEGEFPLDLVIKAQNKTAEMLGAGQLRFLTGGSSIGIKAALLNGGDILAASSSHQAIEESAVLSNSRVFFIDNKKKDGLCLPLDAQQIEEGLKKHSTVSTVVLTSPDYYGLTQSLESALIAKKFGKSLYIDAAHGAHFLFRPDLFDCSLFGVADMFNLSAHKTLPAYTQTAYLAINDLSKAERVDNALRLLGTTSPNYPMLAMLEDAAEYTFLNKEKYDGLKQACIDFKKLIPCIDNNDFTRLVVDAKKLNTDGKSLYYALKQSGVIAEKFDDRYVIFIVSIVDSPKDISDLAQIIKRLTAK